MEMGLLAVSTVAPPAFFSVIVSRARRMNRDAGEGLRHCGVARGEGDGRATGEAGTRSPMVPRSVPPPTTAFGFTPMAYSSDG